MSRQLWLRQALSALTKENASQKRQKTEKIATQNFESLPESEYITLQTQPIPLHERPLLL